jgi:uncharacterized protein (DUF1697 family)
MTHRYVAFLRAINVGGHVVKMDRLRALFSDLKLRNVETFIASGNVLFETSVADAEALERRIEKHLEQSLGYAVATFLRTPEALRALADHEPFPLDASEPADCARSIGFLKSSPADEAREKLFSFADELNAFHVNGREVYWLSRTKISDSKLSGATFEKSLRMPATFRNVTTVRKLAARDSLL